MKSCYVFCMVFSSIFYGFIDSQSINITSILNNNKTTTKGNETNQTLVIVSTTINSNEIISTSTVLINVITIDQINTTIIDKNRPSKPSLKSHWWIIVVVIVTILIAISIGIIHYYRRKSPYRRFLQNWRSRDDDRDNIILQLEQPEIINSQWPPRISFS